MTRLLVQLDPGESVDGCSLCETPCPAAGPRLVLAENLRPVCTTCGRRHAPALAALVQLADEAARLGRIGRHGVFPPYTALLDLARAAENYAAVAPAADG